MSYEARKRCRWCGGLFTARSRAAKTCPRCRDELNRVTRRLYWHVRGGKLAKEGWRAAVAEAMRAAVAERRRKAESRRCLYCGRAYNVDASGYCIDCRRAGLDSLHKATGRTNGWDLPARAKAAVEGGWRGRPVAGPGSCRRGTVEVAQ